MFFESQNGPNETDTSDNPVTVVWKSVMRILTPSMLAFTLTVVSPVAVTPPEPMLLMAQSQVTCALTLITAGTSNALANFNVAPAKSMYGI